MYYYAIFKCNICNIIREERKESIILIFIMKNSEKKSKFRQSKEWKEFRKRIFDKQDGKDIITGKKLYRGYNVHHLDISAENYDKLIEENFVALNKQTHEALHFLFRYYQKDTAILDKLKTVLDRMNELNK